MTSNPSTLPTDTEFEVLLTNALSPDKTTNTSASTSLANIASFNLSFFLTKLGSILSNETKETNIRQLSAVLMKNYLIRQPAYAEQWRTKIPSQEKEQIKILVLSSLASQFQQIRSGASTVIASICKIEQPIMSYWPALIPSLTKNAFHENVNMRLAAIETLGYVCEELTLKGIDTASVDSILDALIRNMTDKNIQLNVLIQCLKSMFYIVKLAEKNFATENEMKIIMNAIFEVIAAHENDKDVLDKIAMIFIEMFSISSYYDYVSEFFVKIMQFAFFLINNKYNTNDKLVMLGLEIICTIGDEELERESSPHKITIKTSSTGAAVVNKPKSRKYFNQMWKDLTGIIQQYVALPKDGEDDNEWTLSKGCLVILGIMVRVVDNDNMKMFFNELDTQLKNPNNDIVIKCKCWLLLASCVNSHPSKEVLLIINQHLHSVIFDITSNKNYKLQKCASFLLVKITKHLNRIISAEKLEIIIKGLLPCVKIQSPDISVAVNTCIIIKNIIKMYGDKNTNRSSNPISPLFQTIIQGLFIPASVDAICNVEVRLIFNRIMTLETLINYSSHDKQEALIEILLQYLQQTEYTIQNYDQLQSQGSSSERVTQLQDYYYLLFRTIFQKYTNQIPLDLGKKIWILTETLLKFRKTVFEEANLALGSLALNMKQTFTEIFTLYFPFLDFSIKQYSITGLTTSGLASLLNSIRSLGGNISSQCESIVKTLIDVCTSSDVSRNNKTIAITCLGEIALTMELRFEPFLSSVMELLFSACKMGIEATQNDDNDEDTIEFVKCLRFELVQAFTCIQFAMDSKKEVLLNYIPHIFEFFKLIVKDTKCERADILKAVLSFIVDTVSLFGKDVKQLCNQEFISELITKLKAFKVPAYEMEIIENEQVLSKLFI